MKLKIKAKLECIVAWLDLYRLLQNAKSSPEVTVWFGCLYGSIKIIYA